MLFNFYEGIKLIDYHIENCTDGISFLLLSSNKKQDIKICIVKNFISNNKIKIFAFEDHWDPCIKIWLK